MKVLLAAGGTGGHLRPAVATAEALLREREDASILFLTTGRAVDDRFFEGVDVRREPLFPDREGYPARSDVLAWTRAFSRARALLRSFAPDVVVGFGSYPTALAGAASLGPAPAAVLRLASRRRSGPPLVLLDQNAIPGQAVKVLARVARKVLLSFEAARAGVPRTGAEVVVTGNPLPRAFTHGALPPSDRTLLGLDADAPTVVCLGGSQGARAVNEMVLAAREELARRCPGAQVLLLTGEREHEAVCRALDSEPAGADATPVVAVPFTNRMKEVYARADVVVARAGGTTLAELAVVGRPLVLVPYPHSKDRHQFANARVFEEAGAARVVEEGPRAAARLVDALAPWLADEGARAEAGRRARTLAWPDAAERCAREILALAEGEAARR